MITSEFFHLKGHFGIPLPEPSDERNGQTL